MEQRSNIIPSVKVEIFTINSKGREKVLNLNQQGLVSMEFERYLSDIKHRASNIMTDLDLTMFDSSGYTLLSAIQSASGSLFIRYGFDDNMSPRYKITPTRYNTVQNNRGIMLGLGGFGIQDEFLTDKVEVYKEKTNIRKLLEGFARRNNWFTNNGEYINVSKNLVTPSIIYRDANTSDFNFIKEEIIPLLSRHTVFSDKEKTKLITNHDGFYDTILEENAGRIEFHIFPTIERNDITRNVWEYTYGVDTKSLIIEMTNKINYDWIVNGLTVRVPLVGEYLVKPEEETKKQLKEVLESNLDLIKKIFAENKVVLPELENLKFRFQFYESDLTQYKDFKEIAEEKLREIVNVFNTMELAVVGNPHIRAMDRIHLIVKNKDGRDMIQTGYWKIIGIKEQIGLGGYQTKLSLVRDTEIDLSKIKEIGRKR